MLRIKSIRVAKNLTQDEMVAKTGISKRSYVAYENEQSDIPLSKLQDIANVLEVDLIELIKTKSEKNVTLLKGNKKGNKIEIKPKVKKMLPFIAESPDGIPLIPIDAMAGFGLGDFTIMDYDTSRYRVPEFEELHAEFMIRVKGSSMYPKYNSGDVVACKRLSLNDIFFQWNKVYVLDTDQGALIKRVKKAQKEDRILLISDNKEYDPIELLISKIHAIALVIGVIRLE